jgi:hypothetical protein
MTMQMSASTHQIAWIQMGSGVLELTTTAIPRRTRILNADRAMHCLKQSSIINDATTRPMPSKKAAPLARWRGMGFNVGPGYFKDGAMEISILSASHLNRRPGGS